MVPEPTKVEAREGFRIWVEYSDGESGKVDLSDVAGLGIFKAWDDREFFERVHITSFGAIAWNDQIDDLPGQRLLRSGGQDA